MRPTSFTNFSGLVVQMLSPRCLGSPNSISKSGDELAEEAGVMGRGKVSGSTFQRLTSSFFVQCRVDTMAEVVFCPGTLQALSPLSPGLGKRPTFGATVATITRRPFIFLGVCR